jgi:hypothetical protein
MNFLIFQIGRRYLRNRPVSDFTPTDKKDNLFKIYFKIAFSVTLSETKGLEQLKI